MAELVTSDVIDSGAESLNLLFDEINRTRSVPLDLSYTANKVRIFPNF